MEFENTLENIERYLDNNDWILANYWLRRAEKDYEKSYLVEVEKP